jgi:hypothetical protein
MFLTQSVLLRDLWDLFNPDQFDPINRDPIKWHPL